MNKKIVISIAVIIFITSFWGCSGNKAPDTSQMSIDKLLTYGYFTEARDRADSLWNADSTSATALYARAKLREFQGYPREALIHYYQAGLADRSDLTPLFDFTRLAIDNKIFDDAAQTAKYILDQSPTKAQAYIDLARIALKQNRLKEAGGWINSAAGLTDDNLMIKLLNAEREFRLDNDELTTKTMAELSGENFTQIKHLTYLADIYDFLNYHDSTISYCRRALASDTGNIYLKFKLAKQLLDNRNYPECEKALFHTLESSYDFGPALLLQAYLKRLNGDRTGGDLSLYNFLQEVPNSPEVSQMAGDYGLYFADTATATSGYQSALDKAARSGYPAEYRRFLSLRLGWLLSEGHKAIEMNQIREQLDPELAGNVEWDIIRAGVVYFYKEVSDSAAILVDDRISNFKDNDDLMFDVARYYQTIRKPEKAEKILLDLMAKPPYPEKYFAKLLDVYISTTNLDSAKSLAARMPSRLLRSFDIDEKLYNIFVNAGDDNEAVKMAQILYGMAPFHLPYIKYLAEFYYAHGQDQEADKLYANFNTRYPSHVKALTDQAGLYIQLKRLDKAKSLIDKASSIESKNPRVLELSGLYFDESGQYDSAKAYFQSLIDGNIHSAEAYYHLAKYYYESNENLMKASGYASNAVALEKDVPRTYLLAGRIYYAREKYKLALSQFQQGLKLFPKNAELSYEAGRTNIKLDQSGEAFFYLKQALDNGLPDDLKSECQRLLDSLI